MKVNHWKTLWGLWVRTWKLQRHYRYLQPFTYTATAWLISTTLAYDGHTIPYKVYHYFDEPCYDRSPGSMALCLCDGELIRHRQGECPHRMV